VLVAPLSHAANVLQASGELGFDDVLVCLLEWDPREHRHPLLGLQVGVMPTSEEPRHTVSPVAQFELQVGRRLGRRRWNLGPIRIALLGLWGRHGRGSSTRRRRRRLGSLRGGRLVVREART
jgi:hypothetical protein